MVKFKTNWDLREEKPRVVHVDPNEPSVVDFSSPVYSIAKLLDMTDGMNLGFTEGYDDDRLALSDAENFAACDPAADVCDMFAEQEAIVKARQHAANQVLSAGVRPTTQSQADTTLTDGVGNKVNSPSKSGDNVAD